MIFLILITFIPATFATTYPVDIHKFTSTSNCQSTDSCFAPSEREIKKGDTVKWRNLDIVTHIIASENGEFRSEPLQPQTFECPECSPTFSHVFTENGTYRYSCTIHPWMHGVIVLKTFGSDAEVSVSGTGGIVFVEKKINAITSVANEEPIAKIHVYGKINNPGTAGRTVYITQHNPDGSIEELTAPITKNGIFDSVIYITPENRGQITLDVRYADTPIGSISFEVVNKQSPTTPIVPQNPSTPSQGITVFTDSKSYSKSSVVKIYGMVPTFNSSNPNAGDVTIQVLDPQNNIIAVSQITPHSNTSYQMTMKLPFKVDGEYAIRVQYAREQASTIISWTSPITAPTPSPNPPSTSTTFLKLDSLDNTFTVRDQNSRANMIFSGQLLTADRQSYITGEEIKLEFTGFTLNNKDHHIMETDSGGKFGLEMGMPVGEKYGIQAVYDGSSKFNPTKSQTEIFTVLTQPANPTSIQQPSSSTPSGGFDPTSIVFLVILSVIIGAVVVIVQKRKKSPKIAQVVPGSKRAARSSPSGYTEARTFECPDCGGGHIHQNPDGSEFCADCSWRN